MRMKNSNIQRPTSREAPNLETGRRLNPNGISSQSPGLRGTSYPGLSPANLLNPNGVAPLNGLLPALLYTLLIIFIAFACHAASPTFTTLAGSPGTGSTNGTGPAALFSNPQAVATDPAGN